MTTLKTQTFVYSSLCYCCFWQPMAHTPEQHAALVAQPFDLNLDCEHCLKAVFHTRRQHVDSIAASHKARIAAGLNLFFAGFAQDLNCALCAAGTSHNKEQHETALAQFYTELDQLIAELVEAEGGQPSDAEMKRMAAYYGEDEGEEGEPEQPDPAEAYDMQDPYEAYLDSLI